jgi:hypothetical protein
MSQTLKTVADWKAFLQQQPDEKLVMFDMNPITGGSFEYAKQSTDDNSIAVVFNITKHGE